MSYPHFILMSFLLLLSPFVQAKGSKFGFHVGGGLPYLTQGGLSYVTPSNQFSFELNYNAFNIKVSSVSVSLTKPEIMAKWHPFMGSFFLGLGVGQQTLSSKATDTTTGLTAQIDVKSTTTTVATGWMWGMADGGFFAGMDFGYQSPSGAKTTITSDLPTTDQTYIDTKEQGDKFGSTGLPLFTLLRFGYLF